MLDGPALTQSAASGLTRASAAAPWAKYVDLDKLWLRIAGQRSLIVLTTVAAVVAGCLFSVLTPIQYTAVTEILIDPAEPQLAENGLTAKEQLADRARLQVESQIRVLMSGNVLRRVIISEQLDQDPEFTGRSWHFDFASSAPSPMLAALRQLERCLRVSLADRSQVVGVSASTGDREKSARIANAVAQAYLAEQAAARLDAVQRASEAIIAQLKELSASVREAEHRLQQFKDQHGLPDVGGYAATERGSGELNKQLALARIRAAEAKSRFEEMQVLQRLGVDVGGLMESDRSAGLGELRAQYAEAIRREAEQTSSLGPRHPVLIEAQAQVQRLRRVMKQEIEHIFEAARSEYERARASEGSLARSIEKLNAAAAGTSEARAGLGELERDVQARRAAYEAFLLSSRRAGKQDQADFKPARIISKAEPPLGRSWPPPFLLVTLGTLLVGISSGTGLALVRHTSADSNPPPRTALPADLALLAMLPDLSVADPLQALEDPSSRAAVELRRLHDTLRSGHRWTGQSILLAAAQRDGENRAIALNLALLAAANHKVLLIDGDIQRRTLTAILPDRFDSGLVDVASGQKALSQIIVHDARTNLNLLALVGSRAGGFRGLHDLDIKSAFEQARGFDLVIIPVAIEEGDPVGRFFAGLADQIVLVVKGGQAGKRELEFLRPKIASPEKVKGAVLTNCNN
jgi:polysaccharide biosynthesis transport protein